MLAVALAKILHDEISGEERFVLSVRRFVVAELRAALPVGPKVLAFALDVARHHRRRGLQYVLRRAVVLLQANDAGLGKILLELEDVANVGAAPGVDALVLIANGADVVLAARQHSHQLILWAVRVLILVDQQVTKAAVVALAHFGRRLQHTHGVEQQVIEVERVRLGQLLPVDLVDVRDLFGLRIGRLEVNLLRIEHVVLGPRNSAEHAIRRGLLGVDAEALHRSLDDGLLIDLVVDDEILAIAFAVDLQNIDIAAQQSHAERVERRDQRLRDSARADDGFDAAGHL